MPTSTTVQNRTLLVKSSLDCCIAGFGNLLSVHLSSKKNNSRHSNNPGRTTATKGRILEVSDELAVREIIAAICKSRGFDVIQARDGDEALSLYRKFGPFVLVLSDLYWYDGGIEPLPSNIKTIRHGIQLALVIRKLVPEQNIVIHTSASQVGEHIPKELGDIRILEKPFSREELEPCLEGWRDEILEV